MIAVKMSENTPPKIKKLLRCLCRQRWYYHHGETEKERNLGDCFNENHESNPDLVAKKSFSKVARKG
jgi:hypothetical protein